LIYVYKLTNLLGLDGLVLLRQRQLYVARAGHVWVDAAVCAVRAAALPHRLVDLNVADEKGVSVQALDLQASGKQQQWPDRQ
jgi:hypothetical protein